MVSTCGRGGRGIIGEDMVVVVEDVLNAHY